MLKRMDTNVINLIQVWFGCLSDLDTIEKLHFKEFQCFLEKEYQTERLALFLIQVGFDCLSDLDANVKDGYECHYGL